MNHKDLILYLLVIITLISSFATFWFLGYIDSNVVKDPTINQTTTSSITNHQTNTNTFYQKVLPSLVSACISAIVTVVLFIITRKNTLRQLRFDVSLKSLLPSVYLPIIGELETKKQSGKNIDFAKIEKIIIENYALINFAPKNIREIIISIYDDCKLIKKKDDLSSLGPAIEGQIEKLNAEMIKRFGALIG